MKQKAAVVCRNRSAGVCVRAWLDWGTLGGDGHSLGYGGGAVLYRDFGQNHSLFLAILQSHAIGHNGGLDRKGLP